MAIYEGLALIYDEFMAEDHAAWAAYLIRLLRPHVPAGANVLDMGCGTGGISIPLAKAGYNVTAADNCQPMLMAAAEKARAAGAKVTFVEEDAASFTVGNRVDAIVSACDVVNYLPPTALPGYLTCAKAALKPGGMLLFDISTEHYYSQTVGSGVFVNETDNALYIMDTEFSGSVCSMDVTFFLREGSLYSRHNENHILYAHSKAGIISALENADYTGISSLSFMGEKPDEADDDRIQFVVFA